MSSQGGANPGDIVATWNLRLNDGVHTVRFEHGTTSGKRVISVDGQEVGKLICRFMHTQERFLMP